MDEPTAGLDPEERVRFHNLLADIGPREQLAGALLEVVEVECRLRVLASAVGLAVALEQRRDGRADLVLEPAPRLDLRLCE